VYVYLCPDLIIFSDCGVVLIATAVHSCCW